MRRLGALRSLRGSGVCDLVHPLAFRPCPKLTLLGLRRRVATCSNDLDEDEREQDERA